MVETTAPDGGAEATYEATIRRTTDGVPHITGDSVADVVFGQGYANGQDHACTLADQVLKVQGRRAAAFGPGDDNANVDSDFAWLALGIDAIARADWETVTPEVVEEFEAFTAGWNRHLADAGADGLSGWCAGEDWVQPITAADLYAYARSVTLLASGARLTDFIASAQPPGATPRDDDAAGRPARPGRARAATPGRSAPTASPAARAGCSSATRTSRGRASCASGRSTSPCPASSTSTAAT